VNKKADSFVEVFHSMTDRVYLIKAMDAVFFSKIAIGLNKEKELMLELLVRDIDKLAMFLTKFGHNEMSFDMEALPDSTVEVRIEVATGLIARAKNALRNSFIGGGEDAYGKTKYEKLKQLKKQKQPLRTIASVMDDGKGGKIIMAKTAAGVKRFDMADKEAWISKMTSQPEGTVQELVFNKKYPEMDTAVEFMESHGFQCLYEEVEGKHMYSFYKEPEAAIRDMTVEDEKPAPVNEATKATNLPDFEYTPLFN